MQVSISYCIRPLWGSILCYLLYKLRYQSCSIFDHNQQLVRSFAYERFPASCPRLMYNRLSSVLVSVRLSSCIRTDPGKTANTAERPLPKEAHELRRTPSKIEPRLLHHGKHAAIQKSTMPVSTSHRSLFCMEHHTIFAIYCRLCHCGRSTQAWR